MTVLKRCNKCVYSRRPAVNMVDEYEDISSRCRLEVCDEKFKYELIYTIKLIDKSLMNISNMLKEINNTLEITNGLLSYVSKETKTNNTENNYK